MKRNTVKHRLDGLAALLLFAVFAVCVLMVLLTGADAYRGLTERDNAAHAGRTCTQYLTQRVHQADAAGGIAVDSFGGADCLVLGAGEEYVTRVYCWEGNLMELYSAPEDGLDPEDGESLFPIQGLELSLDDGRLTIELTGQDGRQEHIFLSLRSGEGGSR